MKTIRQTQREVESCVKKLVALGQRRTATATEVEEQVWLVCLELGRAVMALFFRHRAAAPRRASYEHDGCWYEIAGRETTEVGTRLVRWCSSSRSASAEVLPQDAISP